MNWQAVSDGIETAILWVNITCMIYGLLFAIFDQSE